MGIGIAKKEVSVTKLQQIFEDNPRKKKEVQDALNIDRFTMSKILNKKRRLEGGELLTVATVLGVDPLELAN